MIAQILTEEPARPRQIRPGLPRDLETIILTCLAKDPAQAVRTAQALADDLRAVLDGRPIQARRATPVERVARWAKRTRRASVVSGVSAAVAVVLVVGALLGWQYTTARGSAPCS